MDTFITTHEDITISNNGKTVTSNRSGDYNFSNAYGSIGIKSNTKNKYKWRLTCKKRRGNCGMFIGIISNRDVNADFNNIDYGYDGYDGNKYRLGAEGQYGIKWGTGDMIEMSVDFGRQEIGYKVNGVDQGIAFRMHHLQLHKTYYLVVSMQTDSDYKGVSIILDDFIINNNEIECKAEKENEKNEINKLKKEKEEITNQYEMMLNEAINNQQNQKKQIKFLQQQLEKEKQKYERKLNESINNQQNQIKSLTSEIIKLSDEKKEITNHYEMMLNLAFNNQNNQIKHLQQQLDDKNNEIHEMKAKSEREKQELTNKYGKKLNEAINNQRNQINNLKSEINKLLDEKKEMEFEMNELKKENERLNRNNLDYSSWRKWDSKKVFYFIINSVKDGSLKPYEKNIKKEIFESEYSGKDLVEIDINDIKSMGIKKISVRKAVFKAIQKLIQNKPQMDEGIASNVSTAYI